MTAQALNTPNPAPDTETRVIVDLMHALIKLLNRCDLASQAGGQTISIAMVRTIAASALHRAQENAQRDTP